MNKTIQFTFIVLRLFVLLGGRPLSDSLFFFSPCNYQVSLFSQHIPLSFYTPTTTRRICTC